MSRAGRAPPHLLPVLAALAVLAGALLRNVWIEDMEWKGDEQRMYADALSLARGGAWPWVGMPSGVGTLNPGMGVWVFAALAWLGGLTSPTGLARAVTIANTFALALLAFLAVTRRAEDEPEAWSWAVALAAVSPSGVQLQRKIWAQSLLPTLCVAIIAAWWARRSRSGAFAWGLLGACLGQVHMSGFFWAAALAGWTALAERRRPGPLLRRPPPTRWRAWLAGTVVGGWPLVPWARAAHLGSGGGPSIRPRDILALGFPKHVAIDVAGAGTQYSLGPASFGAFLREPLVSGVATHGVLLLHAVAVALAALALAGGLWAWVRSRDGGPRLFGGGPTPLLQNAALFGFGVLMTLASAGFRPFQPHYLIVLFPLLQLTLARVALAHPRGRRWLGGLVAAHALLAAAFLLHVHARGGAPEGDYGVSYRLQRR